jgi:putative transcription factor
MQTCDLCGRRAESLNRVIVEGGVLSACGDCSAFGRVIKIEKPVMEEETRPPRIIQASSFERVESINPDYASMIKSAREKLKLKQEEVAVRIAEKESTVQGVESGHIEPSIRLARKFEQFFRIKLIEQKEEKREKSLNLGSESLTIGDLLKLRKG